MGIKYRAINKDGLIRESTYDSENLLELKEYLDRENLLLINYSWEKYKKTNISLKELHEFAYNLHTLNGSGIDLLSSMKLLKFNYSKRFNESIERIINNLEMGDSLSKSILKEGRIYPDILSNMIEVGESSGRLDNILYELSNMFEYQYDIKEEFKSALIYPLILLILSIFILFIMLIYIIPSFLEVFEIKDNLPVLTRSILYIGEFIKKNNISIMIVSLIFFIIVKISFSKRIVLEKIDRLLLRIKPIRDIYIGYTLSNYFYSLGMLLESGQTIIVAIDYCNTLVKNTYLKSQLDKSKVEIEGGLSLSEALSSVKYIRKDIIGLLKVGEQSGNMSKLAFKVAKILNSSSSKMLKVYIGLIEPALLIFMSIIIGVILISVISPVFEIVNIL